MFRGLGFWKGAPLSGMGQPYVGGGGGGSLRCLFAFT